MTRTLYATAYQLACWDAAKQAKREDGLDHSFEIELVATSLLDNQYEWYLERAARLRRVQQ